MPPRRKTSVLTPHHRQYLMGCLDPANEADYRRQILDGLHLSVFDFYLILREFGIDDIRKAFQEREKQARAATVLDESEDLEPEILQKFGTALPSLFGLPYIQLYEDERKADNQPLGWRMEMEIELGIQRALNRLGKSVENVDVEIEIDLGDSLEDLAHGDLADLDHSTLSQLNQSGHISDDEFAEAWVEIKRRRQNGESGP